MTPLSDAARTAARRAGRGAAGLALAAWALILIGALVRAHGAGLSCPDWPLCHGQVVPDFDAKIALEWGHRALAGTLSLGVAALAAVVLGRRELRARFAAPLGVVVGLLGVQVVLGGLTVLWARAMDRHGPPPGRELVRARARLAVARSPGRFGGRAGRSAGARRAATQSRVRRGGTRRVAARARRPRLEPLRGARLRDVPAVQRRLAGADACRPRRLARAASLERVRARGRGRSGRAVAARRGSGRAARAARVRPGHDPDRCRRGKRAPARPRRGHRAAFRARGGHRSDDGPRGSRGAPGRPCGYGSGLAARATRPEARGERVPGADRRGCCRWCCSRAARAGDGRGAGRRCGSRPGPWSGRRSPPAPRTR